MQKKHLIPFITDQILYEITPVVFVVNCRCIVAVHALVWPVCALTSSDVNGENCRRHPKMKFPAPLPPRIVPCVTAYAASSSLNGISIEFDSDTLVKSQPGLFVNAARLARILSSTKCAALNPNIYVP